MHLMIHFGGGYVTTICSTGNEPDDPFWSQFCSFSFSKIKIKQKFKEITTNKVQIL
jgi:hypothetical protein